MRFLSKKRIIFFFPYYHAGGAERVHSRVASCLGGRGNIVIFTDRSRDSRFKKEFKNCAKCYRLFGAQNKNKIINDILLFVFSFVINRLGNTAIVGSNSLFFYRLLPKLKNNTKKIDIIHSLYGPTESLAVKAGVYLDKRVIITPSLKEAMRIRYRKQDVPDRYMDRVRVIENRLDTTAELKKDYRCDLQVLYIGRNSPEKRPGLAVKVFEKLPRDIKFTFVGRGLGKYFKAEEKNLVYKSIANEDDLRSMYTRAHIIFLTSSIEGFPMVFMEAMSYGVVPVSTTVGAVTDYLTDQENSLLINEASNDLIVEKIFEKILLLKNDRKLLERLSINSHEYAKKIFSNNDFCQNYIKILDE